MNKLISVSTIISLLCCTTLSFSQTKVDPAEVSSSVPELTAFHDVIFPMWHEAYPAKNYEQLKGFIPQIKTSVESINKAKLPGILRDKETEWNSRLKELNTSVQNYFSAAKDNDNNALLAAAESLHSTYEKMVRVIRPATKEIDEFHQTLYVIYHKLYPESKYSEISRLSGALITKAQAILNFPHDKLKNRLGDKLGSYDTSAKKLYDASLALQETLKGVDNKKKGEAVESVHRAYTSLEALFD